MDENSTELLMFYTEQGLPSHSTVVPNAGLTSPMTLVSTLAQGNAEFLALAALMQMTQPGTPLLYSSLSTVGDMRSGAYAPGGVECGMLNMAHAQMARFYNVPCSGYIGLTNSKLNDAQAGYESATTMMAALMSGANYIWHSAGWNEAGMHCSFAKFVVDAEQCAMAYRMTQGPDFGDFDEALAAVWDIGPGGHYLGHAHTQKRFQQAFFIPRLFDNNSIEQWQVDGSMDLTERALIYARNRLNEYEQPKLDPAVNEALLDYIARREGEIRADVA